MALQLVLESFDSSVGGVHWRFRPGDLVEDGVAPVVGTGEPVPVVALRAQGLAYIPYVAGTMAAMRAAYLADHGVDDDPPSMIAWLVQYSVALSALTPLTGVVDPNGVVIGAIGQLYYDTAHDLWYACHSNPTGTVWDRVARVITTAGSPNAGAGTAGNIGDLCVDTTNGRVYVNLSGAATGWRCEDDEDLGAVAAIVAAHTGQPGGGETIVIGPDTYTVGGGGAFGFALGGGAEATYDNLITAANAAATGNYRLAKLSAAAFAIIATATPHGTPVSGAPALVVTDNLTNLTINRTNLNAAGGRAAGVSKHSVRQYTLGAAEAGFVAMTFPFDVARYQVTARSATGVFKAITETSSIPATALHTVIVSVGTGATPLVNTDVLTVEAWS